MDFRSPIDVASGERFVTDNQRVDNLIGLLVSIHSLVFFLFSDVYCFFDPPVHFDAFSVDHFSLMPIQQIGGDRIKQVTTTVL